MTSWDDVRATLKPFQVASAEAAIHGLWRDDTTSRFLVADEVGLGKTLVAKGVIAHLIEELKERGDDRIDIVYICSNRAIARQNLLKLQEFADDHAESADRLTKLVAAGGLSDRGVNVVALTPGTSFTFGHRSGQFDERALLYALLHMVWPDGRDLLRRAPAKRLFFYGIGEQDLDYARARLTRKADEFERRISSQARRIVKSLIQDHNTALKAEGHQSLYQQVRSLAPAFRLRNQPSDVEWEQRQQLMGDLRQLLAEAGVKLLRPDLVVMDEFQRFADLLDPTSTSKPAQLLRTFISSSHDANTAPTKVLLLSATPYRWFDRSGDGSHHGDFISTLRFLHNDDTKAVEQAETAMADLRTAIRDESGEATRDAAKRASEELRRVITRTERLSSTPDRNGMLQPMPLTVPVTEEDVRGFVAAQHLSDRLGSPSVVELWKTTPWIPNLGDGYMMVKELQTRCATERFAWADATLLDIDAVARFGELDVPNPRLRWLRDRTVGQDWHRLLWMPPSRPYYTTNNEFDRARAQGMTKQLVFSSWRVAPKAIALGITYAAEQAIERQAPTTAETLDSDSDEWADTAYRSHTRTLLDLSMDSSGAADSATSFLLAAPFSGLAQLIDPLLLGLRDDGTRNLADVRARALQTITPYVTQLTTGERKTSAPDVNWYVWAARQLSADDDYWWKNVKPQDFTGDDKRNRRGLLAHIDLFRSPARPSGPAPADLADVLTDVALGSPAVCAARALRRTLDADLSDPALLDAAARVGWGFRSLLDTPEVISVIEARPSDHRVYWRQVLQYAAEGNLQAVVDEYVHMLREWKVGGSVNSTVASKIASAAVDALSFRTVTLDTRVPGPDGTGLATRKLRSRFAVRFGDRSGDHDDERKDVTAAAFNSPFWPFVMATTSIGQEGLDFHLYSHALIHWNLPPDPVSLEQREGRVHRYKGHAVRKNVAADFKGVPAAANEDVWDKMFDSAMPDEGFDGIVPFWVYEGSQSDAARVERLVPMLPMSREEFQLENLRRAAATYRAAFGQPRHDDLLEIIGDSPPPAAIDLSPKDIPIPKPFAVRP